jgi:hypothetical protein
MPSGPSERVFGKHLGGSAARFGMKLRGGSRRRERTRRNRHEADAARPPFDGKASGDGEKAALGDRRGTVKARPVIVEVERIDSTTPLRPVSIQRRPAANVA